MTVYVLTYLIVLFFALCEVVLSGSERNYRFADRYFFVLISIGLFLIAAFRECGFDYTSYRAIYQNLHALPEWLSRGVAMGIEPGYAWLNSWAPDYRFVIAGVSAAVLWLQMRFISRYSLLPIVSLVIYLGVFMYFSTMGQFRQALALAIVLWAVVNRERRGVFFLLIALAMTFHASAVIGLCVLFVSGRLRSARFYLFLFVGAVVCSVAAQAAYLHFITLLPAFAANKLSAYAANETTALGLNTAVLLRASIFFLCYHYRERLQAVTGTPFMMNVYFLSLILYTALGFAPQVASRGTIYFAFFEVILAANLLYVLSGREKLVLLGVFALLSAYRLHQFFQTWGYDYIPYKNWLFDHSVL